MGRAGQHKKKGKDPRRIETGVISDRANRITDPEQKEEELKQKQAAKGEGGRKTMRPLGSSSITHDNLIPSTEPKKRHKNVGAEPLKGQVESAQTVSVCARKLLIVRTGEGHQFGQRRRRTRQEEEGKQEPEPT